MHVFDRLALRFRAVFRGRRVEQDLSEELRFHLDEQIEANVRLGMSPAEATRDAHARFGALEASKEECRDARGVMPVERTLTDIRYAARTLRRTPGFTIVAIAVLALGIGAATAVFTIVNGVLLTPLPYPEPDRVVRIFEIAPPSQGSGIRSVANPTLADWRARTTAFAGLAAYGPSTFDLAGGDGPEQLNGAVASNDLFRVLGATPFAGRLFTADEERPGGPRAILLSYELWRRRFGADRDLIGRTVTLDRQPFTVVGVMREGFAFPPTATLWASLAVDQEFDARQARHLGVLGRLAPAVTLDAAAADLLAAERGLAQVYPKIYTDFGVRLIPLPERIVGGVRPTLVALFGAVACLLLIACANVGNLMLARGVAREPEIALRLALGASRTRVVRQVLVECLLLFGVASGLGLLLASWAVSAVRIARPAGIPRLETLTIDVRVLVFAVLVTVTTALVFGLIPALRTSKPDLLRGLRGVRSSGGVQGDQRRLRSALTVAQTAIAAILLVGAGLMLRSLEHLARVDPGFAVDGLLAFNIGVPSEKTKDTAAVVAFFEDVRARLEAIPGVISVGMASRLPLSGEDHSTTFRLPGESPDAAHQHDAQDRAVTSGYFGTLGVQILRGREFTTSDRAASPAVVIINQTLARKFFADRNPVGEALVLSAGTHQIVGVVADTRQFSLDLAAEPELYQPHAQRAWPWLNVVLRTRDEPRTLAHAAQQAIWSLDADMPVTNIRTFSDMADEGIAERRVVAQVLTGFAAAAFILATLGLYGVMAYQIARSRTEIGIRMALGATRIDVLRLVTSRGVRLCILGAGVGLITARFLTHWLETFLYGVTPADPLTFAGIALVLILVGTLACVLPARRAARIDPWRAIRAD